MSGGEHHVERYVRDTFGLDEIGLKRVAVFLLAHVLVDTRLIARTMFKTISERSAGCGLPLTTIQEIADEVANGTFGEHLTQVSAGLPGDTSEVAREINKARNALMHWKRGRFSLPVYKGRDVTTEAGFQTCMDDVLRFIQTVPFDFRRPAGPAAANSPTVLAPASARLFPRRLRRTFLPSSV